MSIQFNPQERNCNHSYNELKEETELAHPSNAPAPEIYSTKLSTASQIFYQFKEIQELEKGDLLFIQHLIEEGDIEGLRNTVARLLKTKGAQIEEIDRELATTEYTDLNTLLGEVIYENPKVKYGLDIYWEQPAEFFSGKSLYLIDPISAGAYNGQIVSASKNDGIWIFHLHNRIEIQVTPSYQIKVIQKPPFNESFLILDANTTAIGGVNAANAFQYLKIINEIDDNQIQYAIWKKLEEEKDQIRDELLKPENHLLLETLLDNLVQQRLVTVSPAILTDQKLELAERLISLSQKLARHLKIEEKPEELLKEIVIEANYASLTAELIDKKQPFSISRMMKLMDKAFKQIEKLSGKEIIFFVGNTGSGKSTAVNYFLGAPLLSFTNSVGEKVVDVDANREPQEARPKIGQSIANSETLYTHAYPLRDSQLMLGDCPGFRETRGQDYELCTNLSIDQAIQKSGSIKSIVVTISIHSFLEERGNAIIDLIETIKERFPHTFNPDSLQESSHVFILVTKNQQTWPDTLNKLVDGTRLREFFADSQERLTILLQRKEMGMKVDEAELENVQSRNRIWKCLSLMQSNGQLDFIDVKNRKAQHRLLKKYRQEGSFDKSQYLPLMQGETMKKKFGQQIEISMNIWTDQIIEEYLTTIPQSVEALQEKVNQKNKCLHHLEKAKSNRQSRCLTLQDNQKKVKDLIAELEKVHPWRMFFDYRNQWPKLQELFRETAEASLSLLQKELRGTQKAIIDEKTMIRYANYWYAKNQQTLDETEYRIKYLQIQNRGDLINPKSPKLPFLQNLSTQKTIELEKIALLRKKMEQRLLQLENNKATLANRIQRLQSNMELGGLKEGVLQKKEEEELLIREKAQLENTDDLEEEMRVLRDEIDLEMNKQKELLKRKRNLAICIKLQEQTTKRLRDFAALFVSQETACKKYMEIYDRKMDQIQVICNQELGLGPETLIAKLLRFFSLR